jgi:hypothetical protein
MTKLAARRELYEFIQTSAFLTHQPPRCASVLCQVDDLLMKQLAVERIARQQDTTEARSEIMTWRVADADKRCQTLAQENQRLRCEGKGGSECGCGCAYVHMCAHKC